MQRLHKAQTGLQNQVCENLLEEAEMKKNVKRIYNLKLDNNAARDIRNSALDHFKTLMNEEMEKQFIETDIENKFNEVYNKGNGALGEPLDDTRSPQEATYSARRPLLVEHIERLKQLREDLERQLQEKIERVERRKQELDEQVNEL